VKPYFKQLNLKYGLYRAIGNSGNGNRKWKMENGNGERKQSNFDDVN